MLTAAVIIVGVILLYRALDSTRVVGGRRAAAPNAGQITQLAERAAQLVRQQRHSSAEKAYLQILKLDHKHAPTYQRLGALYIRMKNYDDAIECSQIAAQLSPSAATQYNLGLAYYENGNYIKAVAGFEKALLQEPSVQRYVALAKAFEKLHNHAKSAATLEQAVALMPDDKRLVKLYHEQLTAAGQPIPESVETAATK